MLAFIAGGVVAVLLFYADHRYRKHFKKDGELFVRFLNKRNEGASK